MVERCIEINDAHAYTLYIHKLEITKLSYNNTTSDTLFLLFSVLERNSLLCQLYEAIVTHFLLAIITKICLSYHTATLKVLK